MISGNTANNTSLRNGHCRTVRGNNTDIDWENFDPNGSGFRACCCHVGSCSTAVAISEMIGLCAAVVGTAVTYFALPIQHYQLLDHAAMFDHAALSLIGSIVAFVLGLIVVGLLIWGLIREKPSLLLPHLIAQTLAIFGLAAAVSLFIFVMLTDSDYVPMLAFVPFDNDLTENGIGDEMDENYELAYGIIVTALCSVACLTEIYFFIVIYRTYTFLKAKRTARSKTAPTMQMVSTVTFASHDSTATERYMAHHFS